MNPTFQQTAQTPAFQTQLEEAANGLEITESKLEQTEAENAVLQAEIRRLRALLNNK